MKRLFYPNWQSLSLFFVKGLKKTKPMQSFVTNPESLRHILPLKGNFFSFFTRLCSFCKLDHRFSSAAVKQINFSTLLFVRQKNTHIQP